MSFNYNDIDDVIKRTEKAIGKTFNDFILEDDGINKRSKGRLGHIVEEGLYGLDISNKQAPDFEDLGLELKVTGYRWIRKGKQVSAKERLIVTMINYFDDINKEFHQTPLYEKIENMLLILYEYENDKEYRDFIITHYYHYNFNNIPEKDKIIILKDFNIIMQKIRDGLAHELSERDTTYLGAAPKGASSKSLRKQPFSDELAMSRAYSLKTSYMTYLLREHVFNEVESRESLIKDINLLKKYSLEEIIKQHFEPYKNKTLTEIDSMIGENLERKGNKQIMKSYTSRMLNISERNFDYIEEFKKANIEIKTINLNESGTLTESMSFPAMDFVDVANETWETSSIRNIFESTKFLFVVFQKTGNKEDKEGVFRGSFLWSMPIKDLDSQVKTVWKKTNNILNNEIEISVKKNKNNDKYRVMNNFPKLSENKVSHVRQHGSNRSDTAPLPQNTKIKVLENDHDINIDFYLKEHKFTKLCFWLNNNYILKIIEEENNGKINYK